MSLLNRICDNDSHFTYFIVWVNGLYIGDVWITKPFILISQMKVQVIDHSWNIVPCIYIIFTLNCFLLNCNWRILRGVINMKILQRKACRRNFGLNIFKTAPLFFLKFGHIYWLLLCFIKKKIVPFSVSITLSVLYHPFKFKIYAICCEKLDIIGGTANRV